MTTAAPLARYGAMGRARFASGSATPRSYTTPRDTTQSVAAVCESESTLVG